MPDTFDRQALKVVAERDIQNIRECDTLDFTGQPLLLIEIRAVNPLLPQFLDHWISRPTIQAYNGQRGEQNGVAKVWQSNDMASGVARTRRLDTANAACGVACPRNSRLQ